MTLLDERKQLGLPEEISVLIPEARRHSRLRRLLTAALVAAVAATGAAVVTAMRSGHETPPTTPRAHVAKARPPAPVALGTVLAPSSVTALSMLTPSAGFAVSTTQWNHTTGDPQDNYLTFTSDEGKDWRVVGRLPSLLLGPEIVFTSTRVGYVVSLNRAHLLFVTTDGGRTWRRAGVVGVPISLSSFGNSVWVMSQVCAPDDGGNSTFCPTTLSVFSSGSSAPSQVAVVPTPASFERYEKAQTAHIPPTFAAHLLAQFGPSSGLASEGLDGGQILMETTTAGHTWRAVSTPCSEKEFELNVRAVTPNEWLLACFWDYGMGHGVNEIYRTTSAGASWTKIAGGTGTPTAIIGSNATGTTLWTIDSMGYLEVSTSGGAWRATKVVNGQELADAAAYVGSLDFVGNAAYGVLPSGLPSHGLLRTLNGVDWNYLGHH